MRPALLAVLALALAAPAAGAARAPRVDDDGGGPGGDTARRRPARRCAPVPRASAVGRPRCAVAAGTPLAALAALRRAGGPAFRVRDYASCSRHAADASGLYVSARSARDRARGQDGWVYKVGNRVGTAGAADPRGPVRDRTAAHRPARAVVLVPHGRAAAASARWRCALPRGAWRRAAACASPCAATTTAAARSPSPGRR